MIVITVYKVSLCLIFAILKNCGKITIQTVSLHENEYCFLEEESKGVKVKGKKNNHLQTRK